MYVLKERGRELHLVVIEFQPTLAKVGGRGLPTPAIEDRLGQLSLAQSHGYEYGSLYLMSILEVQIKGFAQF